MLYTIMPPEYVFSGRHENEQTKTECIVYNGVKLEVKSTDKGYRICRILSSDPKVFLNASFAPGNVIKK